MRTIKLLPSEIISRIAAGEVIERPAYAVKELIDNSLDAGADNIIIHLEYSGLKKIAVHDNGRGMSKEDLLESFKIHTTSKVSSLEQLQSISSLGFRGEALASIAAVSELTLQSRLPTATIGNEVKLQDGHIFSANSIGMPSGTSVVINNLFKTTPGRKKFLKSSRIELTQIINIVIHAAIGHPEVSFTLYHNQKKQLFLNKTTNFSERLTLLFAKEKLEKMLAINYAEQYISLQGFISSPGESSTNSSKEYIYINNRHVSDNKLQKVLKDAYKTLLPSHKYPYFIIFIKLPYEFVDINIHPRKEQVGISNKEMLEAVLKQVIEKRLEHFSSMQTTSGIFNIKDKTTQSLAGLFLQENINPWLVRDGEQNIKVQEPIQIDRTFILLPINNGFYLIDQHAAHERILYEQFYDAFLMQTKNKQIFNLVQPIELDLPFSEMEQLKSQQEFFSNLGFRFNYEDEKFFLQGVPIIFQDRNYIDLILELLTNLTTISAEQNITLIDTQSQKAIAYLACRQAVMAGASLNANEMKRLIEQLDKTNNNATCPHGRPTRIYISKEELYQVFKRS